MIEILDYFHMNDETLVIEKSLKLKKDLSCLFLRVLKFKRYNL